MSQISLPSIPPLAPITMAAVPEKVGVSWALLRLNILRMDGGAYQAIFDVQQVASDGTLISDTVASIEINDLLGNGSQKYPLILAAAETIMQSLAQILQVGGLA